MIQSLPTFLVLLAGIASLPIFAVAGPPRNFSGLCEAVNSRLPGRVSYPGSPAYNASQSAYYTAEEREIEPRCVFRPQSASEVSQIIQLVSKSRGDLAIRGGGHMLWPGAANLDGGLIVDMRSLNSINLSEDKKTVSVGGGTLWVDLYPKLTPHNLTVSGARVPGIAVGGYLLGCGVSFFARSHGWSCDHVRGYEVVLSDGRIVYASSDSYRDLWLALKGGLNNFGIVTRFDIETIPQDGMWGGQAAFTYTESAIAAQAAAFSKYMGANNTDRDAMTGLLFNFQNPGKQFSIVNTLFYTKPVADPPVFKDFLATPGQIVNQFSITTMEKVVALLGQLLPKSVDRSFQLVYSFRNSHPSLYRDLVHIFGNHTATIADVENLAIQFFIQPHPISNGTNSLGLDPKITDYVMATVTAVYTNERRNGRKVRLAIRNMVDGQEKMLRKKGIYLPFKYVNYADESQEAIASYGDEVVGRLRRVSRKFDVGQVFQRRVPGGFKLW
ncbi:FAD-binding domain-containing protein [Westerdykella ornata]|uniref:FAD-binding domain-containing protein n=1 Tax=Westerdykella ornata TaxID=318751 RepID=A0A6A6JX18_WESOR|nr:FAD-binding domain-containing protein [Westerdykella ornata]KAF2281160.1 FAD-binding domain-containing protein [Westerdykella ornata]